jgi:hypothetical protein
MVLFITINHEKTCKIIYEWIKKVAAQEWFKLLIQRKDSHSNTRSEDVEKSVIGTYI